MGELKKYQVIDLFAGAGGLSNGFEQTGRFEVIGAVEINPAAVKTYIENHHGNKDIIIKTDDGTSDITKIDFSDYIQKRNLNGNDVIVIGGPPCQGFSNANRQKNYLISGNNQLVKEYVRAIDEIRPVAFLMENVKTMDSDVHKFFVTKDGDETKFRYGSESHLQKLMEFSGEKLEELVKDETIYLAKTSFTELEKLFEEIINFEINAPLVEPGVLLSRLRSIERKARKSLEYQLKKSNEKREVELIISHLTSLIDNDSFSNLNMNEIVRQSISLLRKLVQKSLKREELLPISRLLDINQLLLNIRELETEKIVYQTPILIPSGDSILVTAEVKSYNVVKYLQRVFKFFNYDIEDKVLNATNYGVPQKRNRFMILGIMNGKTVGSQKVTLPGKVFPEIKTTRDAIGDLESIAPGHNVEDKRPLEYKEPSILTDLQRYYRYNNSSGVIYNHINTKSNELSLKRFEAIKNTGGKNFHSLNDELKSTYADASRTQNTIYLRLRYDEPSPTVVNVRKSMWNHPVNAVALSIREAARLQTFRDNFIFHGSKDQQYQQIGNAVPPLMARAVAEQMLKLLNEEPTESIAEEFNLKVLEGSY